MTTQSAPEDLDERMARLAVGDRAVFGDVFRLLWGPTQRLCQSLLHNEADAQDAAQEAMQKILERASDYDPTRPALPWALAIAGWECRTLRRKRGRRREAGTGESPADETTAAGLSADPGEAERALVERDLANAALTALGGLSATDREVLVATFWEEAGSGPTFRKRRERALGRLRDAFRRLYGLG
jgi:RNA polymerase sigma-70 factor, ECF subfamily